jgi:TPP-dependent pyruvate/acetoin dehydrogenase alpha subunit
VTAALDNLGSLVDPLQHREPVAIDGLADETVLRWFRSMLRIRLAEEAIAGMVESGEARCPCHLGIGQEAVAVGVADHVRPTDRCFGAHRSHSHYLALGASLDQLMAEVLGKVTGCSRGYGGSMHLRAPQVGLVGTVPIVAATIPIATGAALAAKLDGRGAIAVSFLGDGATEEGVFHESLNLASSMSLPVLFVIENNLYSSHLHIDLRQPNDRVARFAEAHAIEARVIDGNDVAVVSTVVGELVDAMRREPRPFLIEAVTYRWRGHVGYREDMDVGVERTDNLDSWKQRDPIGRLEVSLLDRGLQDALSAIRESLADEVDHALKFARQSEYPSVDDLLRTVYSNSERP